MLLSEYFSVYSSTPQCSFVTTKVFLRQDCSPPSSGLQSCRRMTGVLTSKDWSPHSAVQTRGRASLFLYDGTCFSALFGYVNKKRYLCTQKVKTQLSEVEISSGYGGLGVQAAKTPLLLYSLDKKSPQRAILRTDIFKAKELMS